MRSALYLKSCKMSLVLLIVVSSAFDVVFAQDDYGNPESALLRPSAQLSFSPQNFQSLLGSSGFNGGSSQRLQFPSSSRRQGSSSPSNDILIEDFSLPQSSFPSSNSFSSSSGSFSSGSGSFGSGSFSSGSGSFPSSLTSSTFQAFNTPPTTTIRNSNRFSSSGLDNSFSRQTAFFPTDRLPSLPSPSSGSGSASSRSAVPGGVDFSQATRTADGRLCVIKEESVETLSKDPILQCTHKNMEKCHYTYVTYFKPAQEEVCEENFEKTCQITFKQEATRETIRKCYRPIEKVCNGQGEEECRTVYESSCSTRYIEKTPGKFVGDTACEKLPVEICGAGCVMEEGEEECHDKQVDTLVDVPEEVCDLNPQKTCRLQTKLVPSLKPKQECTTVPQETCSLNFSSPKRSKKPLRTEWCLDEEATAAAPQPRPTEAPLSGYSRNL